jgi:ABC-type transporter Mla MlaB component
LAGPEVPPRPQLQPGAVVLIVQGRLDAAQMTPLCDDVRRALKESGALIVDCDVAMLAEPDVGTIDALARMSLTARRLGRRLRLVNASPQLQELVLLAGLLEVMPFA